jgi:hypothetical protein
MSSTSKSSSQTRNKDKDSPLLRLPGELRNRIYELALPGPRSVVHLTQVLPGQPGGYKHFGLVNINRQIQAEYRPMLLRRVKIELIFQAYPAFDNTFYAHGTKFLQPLNLDVVVSREDNRSGSTWVLRPLMLRARTVEGLRVRLVPLRLWDPDIFAYEGGSIVRRSKHLHWVLDTKLLLFVWRAMFGWNPELLEDVKSGFISDFQKTWRGDGHRLWSFTVQNKNGKLSRREQVKFRGYH